MSNIFSADQIINKGLFARGPVPLKRLPQDSAPVIYTVQPGARAGTVYSWLDFKPGVRKNLYWMFYDENKKPYYAEHLPGRFATSELREQGALTIKEQLQAEARKNETWKGMSERLVKTAIFVAVGFGVFKILIDKKPWK